MQHKTKYKQYLRKKADYCSSFELMKEGNVSIILIEEFPCNSKDEASMKEREWIDMLGEECVNQISPFRTDEEILEQMKQYRQNNKEKILERQKQYYEGNREKRLEQMKQYYEGNKEKILERHKCICGSVYSHGYRAQHFKTKKHQTFVENQK
jgi:hypothetical protein